MSDEPTTLTAHDVHTIKLALSYAVIERESYAHATAGSIPDAHEAAKKLVKRFEKLNQKIFGEPTIYRQQQNELDKADLVSIHELSRRANNNGDEK